MKRGGAIQLPIPALPVLAMATLLARGEGRRHPFPARGFIDRSARCATLVRSAPWGREMLGVAGLLFLTGQAVPSPAQPRADPRAEAVIDRAVAAMGGLDRIHAIRSLVMRGFHYEGAYHQEYEASHMGSAVMVRMRPEFAARRLPPGSARLQRPMGPHPRKL